MPDPTDIYNWRRISAALTTSGQPDETQLAAIRDLGVRYVVNLGLHSHERALADEGASVAALGMTYIHIPVAFDSPQEADFDRFCAVMGQIGAARAHVHCIANYRVTAFLYRYQRDVLGMAEAPARAAMDSVWTPGGVWAKFIGEGARAASPHGAPR